MAPHLAKHIDMLEKVQMRATKLVDGLGNIEYSERLRRLNLPTLVYRRMRGDVIEIFKHLHTYDVETLSPSFQLRNRPSRKHGFQLRQRKAKDGLRGIQSNGFYCRAVKLWNDLPRSVVYAQNVNILKDQLNDAWKDLPIKFDHKGTTTSDS